MLMAAAAGLLWLRGRGYVPLGAVGFQGAARGGVEGFADWSVGGEGVLVGFLEEGGECECVRVRGVVEEGGGDWGRFARVLLLLLSLLLGFGLGCPGLRVAHWVVGEGSHGGLFSPW